MTGRRKGNDPMHQPRRDRMYEEHVKDPYIARGKPPEPTACPDCDAIFHKGRWRWGEAPEGARRQQCPACSRIRDRVPAAILTLSGDFFSSHREEIMKLVRHTEERETAEHPLERIMEIADPEGESQVVISYTGIHLAKGTGEALQHAYRGSFDFAYPDRDTVMHASWKR